jgi:hypothetical protein
MAEENPDHSPPPDTVEISTDGGVGLYVEVHMAEDCQEPTVSQFVKEALSRGHTVAYDRNAHRRVDMYVAWSYDQDLEAQNLKQWIATLPFVRLLTIEYAYDGKRARDIPREV